MKNYPSKNWWWKKFITLNKGDKRRAKFDGHQEIIFKWELARRNYILDDYPAFWELKKGEYEIAYHKLNKKHGNFKSPAVVHYVPSPYVKYGASWVSFPDKLWNLRDSKNALQTAFWKLIETEREARGIKEPVASTAGKGAKTRNAGNNARIKGEGPPWRWLELIDNPHGLTSNERSHLSAARKKRAELKSDFDLIWQEIEEHRQHLALNPENKVDRNSIKW